VESIGRPIIFPTREILIQHNRWIIQKTKGLFIPPDNLQNPNSLDWALSAIQFPIFGKDLYPTLPDKAVLLCWTIINDHVFYDGNKRTGMFSLETFLLLNSCHLKVSSEDIVEIALKVVNYREVNYSKEEFVKWIVSKLE
jgi:death-on-curing protein